MPAGHIPKRSVKKLFAPFVLSEADLVEAGYKLEPLSLEEMGGFVRCEHCHRRKSQIAAKKARAQKYKHTASTPEISLPETSNPLADSHAPQTQNEDEFHILDTSEDLTAAAVAGPVENSEARCRFHVGTWGQHSTQTKYKSWDCCDSDYHGAPPCSSLPQHEFPYCSIEELEANWQLHPTPNMATSKREAVVIDCEMGLSEAGESELIRLTMIDYSGMEILINANVYPDVPMKDYLTKYSGVTEKQMLDDVKNGDCFMGRAHARRNIWKYVGESTMVIMHGGTNDLQALRWIHPTVIDTYIIAKKRNEAHDKAVAAQRAMQAAIFAKANPDAPVPEETWEQQQARRTAEKAARPHPSCSLKELSWQINHDEIQTGPHESLEDVEATRNLLDAFSFARETGLPLEGMLEPPEEFEGNIMPGY